ncbi:diaminopimelate epimerase [Chitinophagaceae bacterium MMS25-I14]
MNIHFAKYQGAGNDFILIDNRNKQVSLATEQVAAICHRRFGIGADGLMLLERAEGYDFHMVYFNSDGNESSMCGNGGRCITAFARDLGLIKDKTVFTAIDGAHDAALLADGLISLHMQDVKHIEHFDTYSILNTGSPHYIKWVEDVHKTNVFSEGRNIRNMPEFQPKGINVNFTRKTVNGLDVRTYERGVEDETYSCGTGVTAAAIAATGNETGDYITEIQTPGGQLTVSFTKDTSGTATNVYLKGPAVFVFEGTITI